MTAAEKAATPIFDGLVAEAGLDWPEEEKTGGAPVGSAVGSALGSAAGSADDGKRAGAGK